MTENVVLAGEFTDQAAGLIATPLAATVGVIPLLRWMFDAVPAANTPAGAGVQWREARARIKRLTVNQTPLIDGTSGPGPIGDAAYMLTRGCR
jgi:hypothetical protein